ncbi:MAG: AAA family ATPase [Candidatus Methylomirabilis oxyfera]|nr:AAA family ATPase [Candidatus Methylomirabilis oxyfera]
MSGTATAPILAPLRDTIPGELRARSQWVVWRLELREGEPKPTKVPYYAVGRKASSTEPATWLSFEAAWRLYERGGFDGVGYVFAEDDPYTGIDLDKELLEEDRQTILRRFDSYCELSPSGQGQHLIMKATLPSGGRKKGPIEVYDRWRYFTITGKCMSAYPSMIEERQEAVDWLLATYFSQQRDTKSNTNGSGLDATDDKLLARAFDAANGDKLQRLWNGDTTDYPSASEADMALASLLAFWTGPDAMKLETLMRSSGLAREKWDKRHYGDGQTYLEAVVTKALSGRTEFYVGNHHANGKADRQESAHTQESGGLPLTRLGDLLAEPEEVVSWLVEERLPSGGLSILAAKPKVGKSTLARCLALAVAQGESWLGCQTSQGTVFYLALEEKRAELRRHFEAMGATGEDHLYLFMEPSPADGLAQLRKAAEAHQPVLIVVDPLFRFVRVKDGNDYTQVTAALEPLLTLARQTGAHVLLVHHSSKKGSGDGDGILGSTAIFGSVDTALLLTRRDQYRTLRSIQRYGEDLEEVTLTLDPDTRRVSAGPSRQEVEGQEVADKILEFLRTQREPVTEPEINDAVEARLAVKRRALRQLVAAGKLSRSGKGGKGDPYRYAVSDSCSLVPIYMREQAKQASENGVSSENDSVYSRSHAFDKNGDPVEILGRSISPSETLFEEV